MSVSFLNHGRQRSLMILNAKRSALPLLSERRFSIHKNTSRSNNNNNKNGLLFHQHHQHRQQVRNMGRKAAKMGQHLKRLDEMAHEGEHARAQERKKNKGNKKKKSAATTTPPPTTTMDDEIPSIAEDAYESEFQTTEEEEQDLPDEEEVKARMMKVVNAMEESFRAIRGAEPTPDLFESVQVKAYGAMTPLSSVAQVVISSPTRATISCFDPETAKAVRDGVRDMPGMNFNPQVEDGDVIVYIPKTSMETRKAIVKQLGKAAERSRTRLRNIRRGAQDIVKLGKDGKISGISEDDAFRAGKEIDAVTDECIKELNQVLEKKQATVMDV